MKMKFFNYIENTLKVSDKEFDTVDEAIQDAREKALKTGKKVFLLKEIGSIEPCFLLQTEDRTKAVLVDFSTDKAKLKIDFTPEKKEEFQPEQTKTFIEFQIVEEKTKEQEKKEEQIRHYYQTIKNIFYRDIIDKALEQKLNFEQMILFLKNELNKYKNYIFYPHLLYIELITKNKTMFIGILQEVTEDQIKGHFLDESNDIYYELKLFFTTPYSGYETFFASIFKKEYLDVLNDKLMQIKNDGRNQLKLEYEKEKTKQLINEKKIPTDSIIEPKQDKKLEVFTSPSNFVGSKFFHNLNENQKDFFLDLANTYVSYLKEKKDFNLLFSKIETDFEPEKDLNISFQKNSDKHNILLQCFIFIVDNFKIFIREENYINEVKK